jgi:glycosyltransferase involved in cell wall biosynthesis
MELSIIICTRNRADRLSRLISCFGATVTVPDEMALEIVVVDNNSTDATKSIVENAARILKQFNVTYVFEEKNGLSNARNRSLPEAHFDMLCFLDDDVVLHPAFLTTLNSTFKKYPKTRCFAPRVAYKPEDVPSWFRREGKYAMHDRGAYNRGESSRFLEPKDASPIGAAMVISKKIFERFGIFDVRFGYNDTMPILVPGEETELFFKMRKENEPVFYMADAIVYHCQDTRKFHPSVLCKTLKGIGYWYGTADARNLRNKNIITWAGFPRWYYKRLIKTGFNFIVHRFSFSKTVRYYYRFEWEKTMGYFKGYSDFRKIKGA